MLDGVIKKMVKLNQKNFELGIIYNHLGIFRNQNMFSRQKFEMSFSALYFAQLLAGNKTTSTTSAWSKYDDFFGDCKFEKISTKIFENEFMIWLFYR